MTSAIRRDPQGVRHVSKPDGVRPPTVVRPPERGRRAGRGLSGPSRPILHTTPSGITELGNSLYLHRLIESVCNRWLFKVW